ncbi:MAG: PorV/PorQ family protein [Bacteroidota bacterium]
MARNFALCLGLLLFLLGSCFAQEGSSDPTDGPVKYSNEFLKIGVGARAFGMGNALTAAATDVTAAYWNPAGLATEHALKYPEVAAMHASYFANIANYNYAGFTMPVDSVGDRRFAVSFIHLGIDDIPNTLQLIDPDGTFNFDKLESFSDVELAALFSYAWKLNKVRGLSMGSNIKIIYRAIGRFANAWGVGLDLGVRYERNGFIAGLNLTDATNTINAWTFNTETFRDAFINTGNVITENSTEITRPALRVGLAYDFRLGNTFNLLLSLDNNLFFDGARSEAIASGGDISFDPRAGFELAYKNGLGRKVAFLRGGFYNLQNNFNSQGEEVTSLFPTAGVGLVVKNFTIDYALANIGNFSETLYSHVVSLKFHIQ